MRLTRIACVAYLVLTSVLLLAPDPLALMGFDDSSSIGGRGAHFYMFAVLAFLVHAGRGPLSRRWTAAALIGYALATETLQAFLPTRYVELLDYLENLLGLAAGTVAWWAASKARRAWSARRVQPAEGACEPQASKP